MVQTAQGAAALTLWVLPGSWAMLCPPAAQALGLMQKCCKVRCRWELRYFQPLWSPGTQTRASCMHSCNRDLWTGSRMSQGPGLSV